ADASLDLLLEAYAVAHRFRVGERQLIAPQCSHQLTQVLFAQGDVIANLWRHLDLANLTELLERARPVLGLFELDASLECRTRFRKLLGSLRRGWLWAGKANHQAAQQPKEPALPVSMPVLRPISSGWHGAECTPIFDRCAVQYCSDHAWSRCRRHKSRGSIQGRTALPREAAHACAGDRRDGGIWLRKDDPGARAGKRPLRPLLGR